MDKWPLNILGVWVDHDPQKVFELNFTPLKEKAQGILRTWSRRTLSLLGKVQVVNTLVVSLFIYRMFVLPTPPNTFYRELDNLISNFLWNGKKSKIPLSTLHLPKDKGGAGLVNWLAKDMAIKMQWRNLLEEDPVLAQLAYQRINPQIAQKIWCCNFQAEHATQITKAPFWQDVLKAWGKLNYKTIVDNLDQEILWYNSHIRINEQLIS